MNFFPGSPVMLADITLRDGSELEAISAGVFYIRSVPNNTLHKQPARLLIPTPTPQRPLYPNAHFGAIGRPE